VRTICTVRFVHILIIGAAVSYDVLLGNCFDLSEWLCGLAGPGDWTCGSTITLQGWTAGLYKASGKVRPASRGTTLGQGQASLVTKHP